MVAIAGVIETVGWTGGSIHRLMLQHSQPWYVQMQLDTMSFLAGVVVAFAGCVTWVLCWLWFKIKPAVSNKRQQIKPGKKRR